MWNFMWYIESNTPVKFIPDNTYIAKKMLEWDKMQWREWQFKYIQDLFFFLIEV